jgi:DNA polymerase-3 subunit epsilon
MPIIDKEKLDKYLIEKTRDEILNNLINKEFDFLKENCECNSCVFKNMTLSKVIYCYNEGFKDIHTFIDFQTKLVQKKTVNLFENRILIFDTETNGLPNDYRAPYKDTKNWPRLIQLSWIVFNYGDSGCTQKNHIIKPDNFTIPISASNIHKISTEIAYEKGICLSNVLEEFNNDVNKANYIVGHNLNFDLNILLCEYYRSNIVTELINKNKICTMEATTNYCAIETKYGYKWPSLQELYYKLFYESFEDAHDASVDVMITYKCFIELTTKKIINLN